MLSTGVRRRRRCRRRSFEVRKSYISRSVDLESPNVTRAFKPVGSTKTPYMTSLILPVESYRRSKNGRKCCIRQLQHESPKLAYTSIPTPWSTMPDMTSLTISGWQLSKFKERSKMPYTTASLLHISRTIWARITKFYRHIPTDLPYICTGFDVTNNFWSEATAKNKRKCRITWLWVKF